MAKETSSGSGFKNPFRFNEQVNIILLIMFLSVVLILSLKGCGTCLFDKSENIPVVNEQQDGHEVACDSTQSDSLTTVH